MRISDWSSDVCSSDLADSNSTAILPNGTLGKGVTEVELDRRETPQGSRLEMSHDGYARRHGLIHRRLLILSPNGRELRGEDLLLPAPRARRKGDKGFTMRFQLGRASCRERVCQYV